MFLAVRALQAQMALRKKKGRLVSIASSILIIAVQERLSDSETDIKKLAKHPNIKKTFTQLNVGIPSSAPAEHLPVEQKTRHLFGQERKGIVMAILFCCNYNMFLI